MGPVHVGVRSQTRPHHNRDGTWLVGCCHLIGDLEDLAITRSHPNKASGCRCCKPFRERIGLRVITGSSVHWVAVFFAIASLKFSGILLGPTLCCRRLWGPGFCPPVM